MRVYKHRVADILSSIRETYVARSLTSIQAAIEVTVPVNVFGASNIYNNKLYSPNSNERDGSSNFDKANTFGNFPAASVRMEDIG